MSKLFVDKRIEIDALPSRVWDVLTKPEDTARWASEFAGGTSLQIESDWQIGSPVRWKDQGGNLIVVGTVTALEPEKLLRFTVFDVRSAERPPVTDEDGITYEISKQGAKTLLHVRQGDFSVMKDGEKYHRMSAEVWDRVLLKVKELVEQ